jgi:predicted nucleic acid-binding protein
VREYVLDANAVISFLHGGDQENALKVRRLVQLASAGEAELFISAINLGEVFYTLRKSSNEVSAAHMVSTLRGIASVVEVNPETAIHAAELKYRYKLGYADSFAVLLAIQRKATLVSADPDFEKMGKSLKWMKLRPYRSGS